MLTFFIIFELIFLSSYVSGDEPVKTLIYIDSSNQIIGPGTHFQITIYCTPGQPIKSYEFNIIFNPSLLLASSVSEGDIFDGYDTFFYKDTINNSAGSIVNVFGLILGRGNVTDQGSLAVINFTSLSNSGFSSIVLGDVGVTNDTIYVPITVSKGTIQIDVVSPGFDDNTSPVISNIDRITSNVLDTDPAFGWVNITCRVIDNNNVRHVYLNIINPDSSNNYLEMSPIESNKYSLNSSNAFSKPGNYTYYIQSVDDNSNTVNSIAYQFSMPTNYDINMDGTLNQKDLHSIKKHYGETGQPGWIREDVDNNGIIQILDPVLIQNHVKKSWWLHIFR